LLQFKPCGYCVVYLKSISREMDRYKNLLLIVDMQYDFCLPDGALYVNGAEQDTARLADFIERNESVIDGIVLTQDSHQVIDISHPAFWADNDGMHPLPYTLITPEDIASGAWSPLYFHDEAVKYVNNLSSRGEFVHTIWPEHCISGSQGAAIVDDVMTAVRRWASGGHFFDIVIKGTNPLTEHFGVLRANIPVESAPETGLNKTLAEKLKKYTNIFIAGEARSHCVANTVRQMGEIEGLAGNIFLLWDLMSDVPGFEAVAMSIYENAFRRGIRKETSFSVKLN